MPEKPTIPGSSPEISIEQMSVEQLEQKIKEISEEIKDLIKRKANAKDPLVGKSLELQLSIAHNKRAGYEMERQKRRANGSGQA